LLNTVSRRQLTRELDETTALSAVKIVATVVAKIEHKSAERSATLIQEVSNLEPVTRAADLEGQLDDLQERFEQLERHSVANPVQHRMVALRKSYNKVIEGLGINSKLYRNVIKYEMKHIEQDEDPDEFFETLRDGCADLAGGKANKWQNSRPPPWRRSPGNNSQSAPNSGGTFAAEQGKRICYFDREGKPCPYGDKCNRAHGEGSGKVCTDASYVSSGICKKRQLRNVNFWMATG
jgi:hypothetical protein